MSLLDVYHIGAGTNLNKCSCPPTSTRRSTSIVRAAISVVLKTSQQSDPLHEFLASSTRFSCISIQWLMIGNDDKDSSLQSQFSQHPWSGESWPLTWPGLGREEQRGECHFTVFWWCFFLASVVCSPGDHFTSMQGVSIQYLPQMLQPAVKCSIC